MCHPHILITVDIRIKHFSGMGNICLYLYTNIRTFQIISSFIFLKGTHFHSSIHIKNFCYESFVYTFGKNEEMQNIHTHTRTQTHRHTNTLHAHWTKEKGRERAAKKKQHDKKRCERKRLKTNPCTSCLSQGNHSGILRYLYIVLSHESDMLPITKMRMQREEGCFSMLGRAHFTFAYAHTHSHRDRQTDTYKHANTHACIVLKQTHTKRFCFIKIAYTIKYEIQNDRKKDVITHALTRPQKESPNTLHALRRNTRKEYPNKIYRENCRILLCCCVVRTLKQAILFICSIFIQFSIYTFRFFFSRLLYAVCLFVWIFFSNSRLRFVVYFLPFSSHGVQDSICFHFFQSQDTSSVWRWQDAIQ